jgi:hypothetical protein
MTDFAAEDGKQWRKQQIRMHALEMAVRVYEAQKTKTTRVDVVQTAIRYEDYIFRGKGVERDDGEE